MPTQAQVRQAIETVLGQSIDQVDWQRRMREGIIVELKIKRWRARKKLTLQELGIYPPNDDARKSYEQLLSLGSKLLLPLQTLNDLDAIERGARLHLGQYAIKTPFGLFVPYTTYALWTEGNRDYKARFFAKRDEIVTEYTALVSQLLSEYEQIARHTYQLLMQQDPDLMGGFADVDNFVAHFKQEIILRNVKTADEFAASFVYEEELSRVPLLNSLDTEEVTGEEVETVISEREQERAAAVQRSRMLEQMNRDLVQKAKEQKTVLIDRFLTSLVAQLRGLTYDAVTSVLASIKEQETLQGRPVIQLKNLVDQLNNLNFYGDQDIDSILTLLHSIIEKPAKERNIAEITRQLRAVGTLTRGTILALGEQPREGRDTTVSEIGIPITPDEEEMREARAEIQASVQYIPAMEVREEREEVSLVRLAPVGSEELRTEREA